MIEVVKYKAEYFERLLSGDSISYLKPFFSYDNIKDLERCESSFAAVDSNKRILGCFGVVEYWANRGQAWAIFDNCCKKEFIYIHNAVKRYLNIAPFRRIEAAVVVDFEEGHRWVRALGFELEAKLLRSYEPNGNDCSLYARVRV